MPVHSNSQRGFSLVELVVGLVLTALALTFVSTVFFSAPERSVEPMLQVRASELGQALMDEILAKPYDDTTPLGGLPACTICSSSLVAEAGETRLTFDDVDDYNTYCNNTPPYNLVRNSLNQMPDNFDNFRMSICVVYDSDYDGNADTTANPHINSRAKLITVDIYPPAIGGTRQQIQFRAYRGNF